MSQVDALIDSMTDSAETAEAAEKPEVAEQETEQQEAHETEAETEDQPQQKAEDEAESLKKKAYALERRLARLAADKNKALGELNAERAYRTQIEQAIRAQQTPEEQKQAGPQDIEREVQQRLQVARFDAACSDFVEKGQKAVKNFGEKVQTVAAEVPMFDFNERPTVFLRELMQCDAPYKVLEYLAENPDEAASLVDIAPSRLIRKLAQIETDLGKPIKSVSAAPKPLKPVGGAATSTKDASNMSAKELWDEVKRRP